MTPHQTPHIVLTIAGSDSSGGAGIQADLKTFAALDCYGASVITAVTSQNTKNISDVHALPPSVVAAQLGAVLEDLPISAVKIGMVASGEIAGNIRARARNGELPRMVLDPVLTASTGRRLGIVSAIERLLPYATVATPNVDEASALVGWQVATPADMAGAAAQLASQGPQCVVVTGGDLGGAESVDAVWTANGTRFMRAPRIPTGNTHGTGCTFSAAIAARLAQGYPVEDSIAYANRYVRAALLGAQDWRIGSGAGPLNHFPRLKEAT
ncbi:bifunctional hydroxymethylpyrimidine kinase/phosphomethylpyrimidine kinase [Catellatospora tritici]|uniref:bifunctional hydroxymethylpyrimidine kinase/phosphomethylpyrimidine kinase n=1 Tax=Catellatospora tritici TaxID=2851566 RepID=UPI001C2DD604|nr:bifunctional hydroxymethylpyrimidine kinase/phosphomethylpyrimidine kinase [Catellatospora tritici]MBV1849771.1 bifunctional hydroxymethylpyrimidine kinase/phosphomethylpyrimidine kinase [Catellatospora tritici]